MNAVVVAPAGASWSNALLIGREVVMSGMTAHPASREAPWIATPRPWWCWARSRRW